ALPEVGPADHLDDERTAHPLGTALEVCRDMLGEAARDTGSVFAVGDAHGRLLWVEGDTAALRRTESIHFVAGTDWAEDRVGTNAPGTALALGEPVQIIAGEHFNEAVQRWTCAAAPVRDPDSGRILGVVDLTGGDSIGGPHALAAVRATARAMEAELTRRLHLQDLRSWVTYTELTRSGSDPTALISPGGRVLHAEPGMFPVAGPGTGPGPGAGVGSAAGSFPDLLPEPLRSPGGSQMLFDGKRIVVEPVGAHGYLVVRLLDAGQARPETEVRVSALGVDNALVETGARRLRLSPRHSEILVLLALAGEGMSAGRLAVELSPDNLSTVAVRADVSRLRTALRTAFGVDLLESQPYRLGVGARCDIHTVRTLLAEGRTADLLAAYPGPILPSSQAPGVVEHRDALDQQVRGAVLTGRDPVLLRRWVERPGGADDLLGWEILAAALPPGSPQRGAALGRARALRGTR
ncbi:MAG: GAF domain-containing protein, partial [Kineosporiaceae bacterium]